MRARIASYEEPGLVLRRGRQGFTLAYGEILTAERLASGLGLILHTRTSEPVRIRTRGESRLVAENELRQRGVRIVDEYGAMITPMLEDFEAELAREPVGLRQSSDDA